LDDVGAYGAQQRFFFLTLMKRSQVAVHFGGSLMRGRWPREAHQ
jgi:hypothetical protein